MQLCGISLWSCAVLALVAPSLSDSVATLPSVCPIEIEDGEKMQTKITEMALSCLAHSFQNTQHLDESISLDDMKQFIKNFCNNKQKTRECLAQVDRSSEACLNTKQHQTFQTIRELLETVLESGCVHDGADLASVAMIIVNHDVSSSGPFQSDPFHDCANAAALKVQNSADASFELSSTFFLVYRDAINIKECFANIAEGDVETSTNVASILGEVTNKMKCVNQQDATTVLCSTIDVTLPDKPKICPIVTEDKDRLLDMLNERLSRCIVTSYLPEDVNLSFIDTLDKSYDFMKHFCWQKAMIERCWSDVVAMSSTCLNATQHNLIQVGADIFQSMYDYGCIKDGRSLAYVIFQLISNRNKTEGKSNVVRECMNSADSAVDAEANKGLNAAQILRYYQVLKVFKGCFTDKMHGDNTVVLYARDFLNQVQWNMKCIDPESGNIVPCDTLDTLPQPGINVCPLVGENENDPPAYDLLVDRGFSCLKASRVNLNHIADFGTVEEFRTLFDTFCHNSPAVKHCINDLTSISAICQNQTNHQMFSIFTDFLGTMLETGCKQNGEVFATIMHAFLTGSDDSNREQIKACFLSVDLQLRNTSLVIENLSSQSLVAFRALEATKECFLNNVSAGSPAKPMFESFTNENLRAMKCIHPGDGTTVLCESIVNN